MPLLEVKDLKTYFYGDSGVAKAVDGVSLELERGETLCLVGESGSGKSVTALSLLGLIDRPGKIESGEIIFEGRDISKCTQKELRKIRGRDIAMIFQDPMSSLNPVLKISSQMIEVYKNHSKIKKSDAKKQSIEMLKAVGLPMAESRIRGYPFEMSGGMQQRVSIAMALSMKPKILIADEPTTALDVTVQAQILNLMRQLSRDFGTSIILITHDLGVVAEIADRVMVIYAGNVVETADVETIFSGPLHPYTRGLLMSMPRIDAGRGSFKQIGGLPPDLRNLPVGCNFSPRCAQATERCLKEKPRLRTISNGHQVSCFLTESDK